MRLRFEQRRKAIMWMLLASSPLISASSSAQTVTTAAPRVTTQGGVVEGDDRDGVAFFGGIPFAAPPTGERRWKAPASAPHWSGVRDARQFGPDCPQSRREKDGDAPQSEDCLTLNVATPDIAARKLPVIVSIHGGAYFAGSGRELFRTGMPSIVREGVVLVSPNYRLGRLGFFAHPELTREAPRANANYWLMDQVAALKWVRDNIAGFGGDPDNVTIIGCSAGGSSINALMASPMARDLFARGSAHSAGGFFNANRPLAQAEEQGKAFAGRVGISGAEEALARLRALTVEQILAGDSGAPDFGAIVDGYWLPQPLSTLFARGEIAKVPLISGSTSNEASVFGLMGFDKAVLAERFGIDLDQAAPAYGVADEAELIRQVQTDFIFTSAALGMTDLAARAGVPAWSYYFDYVDEADRDSLPGASHCADRSYWFGLVDKNGREDQALSKILRGYLLNYVRSGDPNGPGLPKWSPSSRGMVSPLVIRKDIRVEPGFRDRQLQPWYAKWQRESGQTLDLGKEP